METLRDCRELEIKGGRRGEGESKDRDEGLGEAWEGLVSGRDGYSDRRGKCQVTTEGRRIRGKE